MSVECSFFFFQAEDGIRDVAVTGVQTCALPISRHQRFGGFGPNAARSIARTVHARRARKPATRPTGGAWLESGVFGTGTPAARCASGSKTPLDRKSTRLNSSHGYISYAVFCLKKKK